MNSTPVVEKPFDVANLREQILHCSELWHLSRLSGDGSDFVIPLWELSMKIAGGESGSGRWFPRLSELAPYLNCHRNQLYRAANLLETAGWWKRLTPDGIRGRAIEYCPVVHSVWVDTYGDANCCKKISMPWDDEPQDELGRRLFGITGGCRFFPQVLDGWRRKSGLTDDELCERAKAFMQADGGNNLYLDDNRASLRLTRTKGRAFRRCLGEFICRRD